MDFSFFQKISITLALCIIPYSAYANFFDGKEELNLYQKIDTSFHEYKQKFIAKELQWSHESIEEELSFRLKENDLNEECIDPNISESDIRAIAQDEYNGIKILREKFFLCQEDVGVSYQDIHKYYQVIKEMYEEASIRSNRKVKEIYLVNRIGMYSDGIEENSPFDLIRDLEEINSILFEKQYTYEGVNTHDISSMVEWFLKGNSKETVFYHSTYYPTIQEQSDISLRKIDGHQSVCVENQSWLSDEEVRRLAIGTPGIGWSAYREVDSYDSLSKPNVPNTQYKKNTDNDTWPCNNFFCITVEFVTYTHTLLGWWGNRSIERIIKKSNEHLKKFVNTSLVQAKMTINNFELWLRDLNLPDIFHVWVQVSYKPVPNLTLDKKGTITSLTGSDYSASSLQERYYANIWLEYDRQNDLDAFLKKEVQAKSALDSAFLHTNVWESKINEFHTILADIEKQNTYLSDTLINRKINREDMELFYHKFAEIETFVKYMMDYAINLYGYVKKMNEIPTSADSL